MTTTDPTLAALLRAVLENPDDDTPRLVMADALEERGDGARAEFVRVQCKLDALRAACLCVDCVRRRGSGQHHNGRCKAEREEPKLCRRERELLHATTPGQWSGFPAALCDSSALWQFRRGFVEAVSLPAAAWLAYADAILAAQPVREVMLTTWEPEDTKRLTRLWYGVLGLDPDAGTATVRVMLGQVWPGTKFTLPAVHARRGPRGDFAGAVEEVHAHILRSLGVPARLVVGDSHYSGAARATGQLRGSVEYRPPD